VIGVDTAAGFVCRDCTLGSEKVVGRSADLAEQIRRDVRDRMWAGVRYFGQGLKSGVLPRTALEKAIGECMDTLFYLYWLRDLMEER
jgi:hypothetical protein